MADGFNETPIRGKHLHNTDGPDETAVATLTALAAATDPAYNEGSLVHLSTDLAGNLRVILSGVEDGTVPLSDVVDRLDRVLGMVRTDEDTRTYESDRTTAQTTALTDNATAEHTSTRDLVTAEFTATRANDTSEAESTRTLMEAVRDALVANESAEASSTRDTLTAALQAVQDALSTNLESVSLNEDTLSALTTANPHVRGAAVDDSNPFPVVLQTNPGDIIDSGALVAVDVAPGAVAVLDGPAVVAAIGRLVEVTASSSVRIRVALSTDTGSGFAERRVFFVDPTSSSLVYAPADRDLFQIGNGAAYRLSITNMDNLRTANVYGSLTHVEG